MGALEILFISSSSSSRLCEKISIIARRRFVSFRTGKILFPGLCQCARFSPDILPHVAVEGLIDGLRAK